MRSTGPAPDAERGVVVLGGALGVDDVAALARGAATARLAPGAMERVAAAHASLLAARERGAVYGATTGVGANRAEQVGGGAGGHGLRLLRSHCAGVGPEEDDETARATMVVRLNQLLAGGSGASAELVGALAGALAAGAVPTLHRWGGIGTADLAPLAELGLTLAGERAWRSPGTGAAGGAAGSAPAAVPVGDTDALPLISSSALTLATAALAAVDLRACLHASLGAAAVSFLALGGNAEGLDDAVHRARPHPGQAGVAAALRTLVAGAAAPRRLQDPFGLRVLPQVLAPALHALRTLDGVLAVELAAPAENPLVRGPQVLHHGQFHAATLAAAVDAARAAAYPVLTLSAARLALLMHPEHTGRRAFLAGGPSGSSGLMIAEYVVQDLLAELRPATAPTTAGSVSISLGVEEHASFATQGARALRRVADLAPTVVAAELVAASRALGTAGPPPGLGAAGRALLRAAGPAAQGADGADGGDGGDGPPDQPLAPLLAAATAALPSLAAVVDDLL